MRFWPLILVLVLSPAPTWAEDTVVIRRAISHEYMDVDLGCPEEYICMDAWFRWLISVDRTLSGPPVKGRIVAAHSQHTRYRRSFERAIRLFVLRPIEGAELRKTLQADYQLLEISTPHEMFCIGDNPNAFGLKADDVFVRSDNNGDSLYCFEVAEVKD